MKEKDVKKEQIDQKPADQTEVTQESTEQNQSDGVRIEKDELTGEESVSDDLGIIDEDGNLVDSELSAEDDWEDESELSSGEEEEEEEEEKEEEELEKDLPVDNYAVEDEGAEDSEDSEDAYQDDDPIAEKSPAPKQPSETEAEYYDRMTSLAQKEVERITGEEYDEFDPKHKVILTDQASKLMKAETVKKEAYSEADKIYAEAGQGFDKHLQNTMQDLSVRQYNALLEAEKKGDYSKTLEVMRAAAESFIGNNKKKNVTTKAREKAKELGSKAKKNKKQAPPKTIRPGAGSAVSAATSSDVFGLEEFGMSEDDIG